MKWSIGRLMEILGLLVVLVGLAAAVSGAGSLHYELICLAIGMVIFYAGNALRTRAEK